MRAYELLKETLCRKLYIWMVHISWLVFYALVYTLFRPEAEKFGQLVWICSGCFLPLLLSAGIIGDDIASGRIRVLIAKPFWPGELYVYRLTGLSLQAAVHLLLAFVLSGLIVLHPLLLSNPWLHYKRRPSSWCAGMAATPYPG